jgi:hypothetical protein
MSSLAEDLLLVMIDPANGVMRCRGHIQYGLMGAELVELAALGRIQVVGDRISVVQPVPSTVGDRDLDAALTSLSRGRREQKVRAFVARPRRNITNSYTDRLVFGQAVQSRQGNFLRPRWPVTDLARATAVRSRLDAVVFGSAPADGTQLDFAALAYAVGLGVALYGGREYRDARKRMHEITRNHWVAGPVARAIAAAEAAASAG